MRSKGWKSTEGDKPIEPSINSRLLSSRAPRKRLRMPGSNLVPKIRPRTSSNNWFRHNGNKNTRSLSRMLWTTASSMRYVQAWDSNKSSYCQSWVSELKYVVALSSPWRRTWSTSSTRYNSDVFSWDEYELRNPRYPWSYHRVKNNRYLQCHRINEPRHDHVVLGIPDFEWPVICGGHFEPLEI